MSKHGGPQKALTQTCHKIPTLLVTKIPKTFPDQKSIFQDAAVCQRCLNIETNSSYYGVRNGAPAISDFLYVQIKFELVFANSGICTCIIVSASHIIA